MEEDEVLADEDVLDERVPLTPLGEKLRSQLREAQRELAAVTQRLDQIRDEQAELEREKAQLEQRALIFTTKVEIYQPLYDEQEFESVEKRAKEWELLVEAGIQECCYKVLLESKEPLEALSIKSELEEMGIDMSKYANPLAVIHTSLKRIPERVRSFKRFRTDPVTTKKGTARYYEAIREKKVGVIKRPKD